MDGIIEYLDSTIVDLEETVNNSRKYGRNEEFLPRWEEIISVLKTRNMDQIIPLVEENIGFFYTTPMGEFFFRNNINRDILREELEIKHYRYGAFRQIRLEELFSDENIKSWLDSLSQVEYDDFVRSRFYYLDKDRPEFINEFLDKFSDKKALLGQMYQAPIRNYIVSNREMVQLMISEKGIDIASLEGVDYQKMWESSSDLIINLSQQERMAFFRNVEKKVPSLIPEALEKLGLLDNIELLSSDYKKLLPFCTEKTKKELFFKFIKSGKDAGDIVASLSLESQRELFQNQEFLQHKFTQSDLDSILDKMSPEIFKTRLNNDVVATPNRLIKFYERTKDVMFLEEAKKRLMRGSTVRLTDGWLTNEDFVEYLTDEERAQIGNMIKCPATDDELRNFFSYISIYKNKNYFVQIICNNAIDFVKANGELRFTIYNGTDTLFSEEELKVIFFSLSKAEQIRQLDGFKLGIKFIYDKLKEDPHFYNGVNLKKRGISFYSLGNELKSEYIEYIFSCLDENQRDIFYQKNVLKLVPSLRDVYRDYVFSNPPNLSCVIEEFFSEEELREIYQECSIEVYTSVNSESLIIKDTSYFDKRVMDFINGINNNTIFLSSWIKYFSADSINQFINGLTGSKKIDLLTNTKDKSLRKKIISVIIESATTGDLLDSYEGKFKTLFTNLSRDEISYLLNNLDNFSLVLFLNKINLDMLETEFMNRIKAGTLSLGQSSLVSILPKVLMTINDENKSFIESLIERDFNAINKFPELKSRVSTMELVAKASFTYAVNNNLIREDNIEFVMDMLKKDPFLFNSLDTRLLRNDVMEMGEHFTRKTSRYPAVAYKLMAIFEKNPELFKFVIASSKHLSKTESSFDAYDSKMEIIINFLSFYDFSNFETIELDENILENFEDYIIQQYRIRQSSNRKESYPILDSKFNCNISNYHEERNRYLNEMLGQVNDINQLRNLFYNRYFWLDYSAVKEFMYSYATNYNDVSSYASSDTPLKYISLIQKVEAIEDFGTLAELYTNMTEEYSISDYITIIGIMKNAYNKANANIVNNGLKGKVITKEFVVDGVKVKQEMIEATPPYGLFVHSTDAYGAMEMINDDYFESWNYNSNTENHGICTCYITNTSYGTADVKGKGVMFGFNKINEHSIATMGPYDLVTRNVGYTITSNRTPLYMRMDKVPSYTRHTHNECDLERRNDTLEDRFPCIQPDCVIIFEDMDETIKQNALKAVEDFRKHGVDLQVVYIDRVKNLKNEGELISRGLDEYSTSYNLNLLGHIIDRYESNICGCDFIEGIEVDEVLGTSKIEQALSDTVEYLRNITDINLRNREINKFIAILEKEQHKFDLIEENIGNRAHKFKLYSEDLKSKIKELLGTSEMTQEKSKVA